MSKSTKQHRYSFGASQSKPNDLANFMETMNERSAMTTAAEADAQMRRTKKGFTPRVLGVKKEVKQASKEPKKIRFAKKPISTPSNAGNASGFEFISSEEAKGSNASGDESFFSFEDEQSNESSFNFVNDTHEEKSFSFINDDKEEKSFNFIDSGQEKNSFSFIDSKEEEKSFDFGIKSDESQTKKEN